MWGGWGVGGGECFLELEFISFKTVSGLHIVILSW